ncbi:MAG TPA: BON domain-containing protein [Candidatus Binataceae bacterium]|nr:BON domain-containing protein [Candidatus Binataceae bacterium]
MTASLKRCLRWRHVAAGTLLVAFTILGGVSPARADYATVLMKRVDVALRADRRLNGATCYTAALGVIVLYGTVFDDKDRRRAEATALKVHGVRKVVNTLHTKTGKWLAEEVRINDTLQLNDLQSVSVRVIGSQAYLSGEVSSEADARRAIRVVNSISALHVVNFMRVVPGSIFLTPSFL